MKKLLALILAVLMVTSGAMAAVNPEGMPIVTEPLTLTVAVSQTPIQGDFNEMKKNVTASKTELDKRIQSMQHYLNDFSQYLEFMGRDIENTGENFKENM